MSSTIFECSICYNVYNESNNLTFKLTKHYSHEQAPHHLVWAHILWAMSAQMHNKPRSTKDFIWVDWRWADRGLQSRLTKWLIPIQMSLMLESPPDPSKQTSLCLFHTLSSSTDSSLVALKLSYYWWKLILQIEQLSLAASTSEEYLSEHDQLIKPTSGNHLKLYDL